MAKKVKLREIAWARSGDKGDRSNVGVMAKSPEAYEIIKKVLTPAALKAHYKDWVKGEVQVYRMDNLLSLEIVLNNGLGGGATRTLRFDQTGKSMGNGLINYFMVEVPDNFKV